MCFHKLSKEDVPKVAQEDIICYKFLYRQSSTLFSPYNSFTWEVGKVGNAIITKGIDEGDLSNGFHSCKSLKDCIRYRTKLCETYLIFQFTIPKGAEYYENETQYVSNQIFLNSATPVDEEAVNQ